MLGRIGIALLIGAACYVVAVVITYSLVSRFSHNTHDRAMEAGMTAFFMVGPLAGIIGAIVGFILRRPA